MSIPGGLKEDTKEIGLIMEDDLEASPEYWRYLKAMHAKYDSYPEIGACFHTFVSPMSSDLAQLADDLRWAPAVNSRCDIAAA